MSGFLFKKGLWICLFFIFSVFCAFPTRAAPPFSALVIDAHTGEVVFSQNADALRYPASLTKMMTLYLLFQDMQAGRVTLGTRLRVSVRASGQPPSHLGLKAGSTLSVQEAIEALVVKSANDVAVVVSENLEASEVAFARRMTRTARLLGMGSTTFRNASGLPNSAQRTTARDMAVLGLRLQRDFPRFFRFFKKQSFQFQGKVIKTHNRLLTDMDGVDGIKTGYIAASGFNLVSSMARGRKRLVGVVLGGKSQKARDLYMANMLREAMEKVEPGFGIAMRVLDASPKRAGGFAPQSAPQQGQILNQKRPSPGPVKISPPQPPRSPVPQAHPSQESLTRLLKREAPSLAPGFSIADDLGKPKGPLPFARHVTMYPGLKATGQGGGSWAVQIGAFPSRENAALKLSDLRGKYKLFARHSFAVLPRELGSKKLYRAQFLGFKTRDQAQKACLFLKKQQQDCLVLKTASGALSRGSSLKNPMELTDMEGRTDYANL